MSELDELYQEVILDHNKSPRNFRQLNGANRTADGYNPLCGDHCTVHLQVDGEVIRDIGFQGSGCAISKASASLMTDTVKGKTTAEALELFNQIHSLLSQEEETPPDPNTLGKLAVLTGVREFPTRVKCATLAWHTLRAALLRKTGPVMTE